MPIFRHSIALLGLCSFAAPLSELTTLTFAFSSIPVNAALVYLSYQFYRQPDARTSRALFRYSLIYLPLIMLLMATSKKALVDSSKTPAIMAPRGAEIMSAIKLQADL